MGLDDTIKNAAKTVAGTAKEAVGKLTDNTKLKAEGKADQVKADLAQAGEDLKDSLS